MMKNIVVAFGCLLYLTSCVSDGTTKAEDIVLEEKINDEEIESFQKIGFEYSQATQQTLGKNLITALGEGGPIHALNFCNQAAIPLTDSIANHYSASIKRATLKPRNPDNRATEDEEAFIRHYEEMVNSGKTIDEIHPVIEWDEEKVRFYYPILTNELCIQCHGKKNEDVSPETLAAISELYPTDEATGYHVKQVRGIWSIEFAR